MLPFVAASSGCAAASTSTLLNVVGWAGCASAWLLFIAPMVTMRQILRAGSIGDFSPLPYLISMLQCFLWTVYALPWVTPCKTQPLVTNGVGTVLELGYVVVFTVYSPRPGRMLATALAMVAVGGAFTAFALLVAPRFDIPRWPDKTASAQTTVLGWTCSVLNVAMYAAPLSVVRTVIRRRSVRNMPLLLTIGCGLCSSCWAAYALLSKPPDLFILAPNVAGLGLFAVQVTVYRCYSPFCGVSAADAVLLAKRHAPADLVAPIADDAAHSDRPEAERRADQPLMQ